MSWAHRPGALRGRRGDGAQGLDVGGQDEDDQILIPLSAGQRRLINISHVTTICGEGLGSAQQEIVFGIYPARQAALQNPVEALRGR